MRKESLNSLQELTGFDRRTIKPRLATLTPEKGPKGALLYWSQEALPLIYERGEGSVYDIERERARLLHHQANIAALDQQVKEKQLIPADVVLHNWQDIAANVRARLLAIPPQLAATCANSSRESVQEKATALIRQALEELAGAD